MTGYFDLLRQHQKESTQETTPPQDSASANNHTDDLLLISENELPPEASFTPSHLEDELLCEETEAVSEPQTLPVEDPPEAVITHDDNDQPKAAIAQPTAPLVDDNISTHNDEDQVANHISQWLQTFVEITHAIFRHCRHHQSSDIQPLKKHITNLLLWLERDTQLINSLELELEQADFKKVTHDDHDDILQLIMKSVMMLLYCLKVTAELKTSHDVRIRLLMASVLQHIGMAQIPPSILNKKGRLSPDELAEIRDAPSKGKAYLQSCGVDDEYLLRGADESNERVDGSGPRGLQGKEICYSARLIGLLSMFEAMIHVRSYRKRMLPREAVRVVVQKFKPAFERTMLKALLDAISLYPIGSFVKLNSKEIGKVISCHPRLPLRPQVRITMDEYGSEIPAREIDLKKHPNLMIEQCAYEDDIQALMHVEEE